MEGRNQLPSETQLSFQGFWTGPSLAPANWPRAAFPVGVTPKPLATLSSVLEVHAPPDSLSAFRRDRGVSQGLPGRMVTGIPHVQVVQGMEGSLRG